MKKRTIIEAKDVPQPLQDFLKSEGLMHEYLIEFNKQDEPKKELKELKKNLKENKEQYLKGSFIWRDTKQEHEYWAKVNEGYEKYVKDVKK